MTSKKTPQFLAGKLLGFYDAGDQILSWINSLDSTDMSVLEFRKALYAKIMEMRPNGSTAITRTEEDTVYPAG